MRRCTHTPGIRVVLLHTEQIVQRHNSSSVHVCIRADFQKNFQNYETNAFRYCRITHKMKWKRKSLTNCNKFFKRYKQILKVASCLGRFIINIGNV